ncbi:MAG: thiamine phosphate synthase [Verrucomicrobia bacterium]|nr:thiamine phosphate synthase [Verrucomicrobiota bacterium]MDA1067391.1 thiamine phosphate synthase [Verrucomicrobiota bacterium]
MTEIIVLSPETHYLDEAAWVVKLFEAGLSRFHLRKPGMDDDALSQYIQGIPKEWRAKLVVHQAYDLVNQFGLGGRHIKDDVTQLECVGLWQDSCSKGQSLSRSVHRLGDLDGSLNQWDYLFLSPVFPSISKAGYKPSWEIAELRSALLSFKRVCSTQVYALGGIEPSTISSCHEMGFDGVALLGAIWQSSNPLESFLKLKELTTFSAIL